MSRTWSLAGIWNASLDVNPPREYEPRDYIWASELGGSYYDRYWKMKGRKPTTPPNLRSRRKFEGGNLTEWIVLQILARAGVIKSSQEYIVSTDDYTKVTGRADFTAGGDIKLLTERDVEDLPETFGAMAEAIIAKLKEKYPEGLKDVNIEIKSCSGMMFDRYLEAPSQLHGLQSFHYAHNTKRPTMLVYVSRDDFRLAEWIILPKSQKWLKLYNEDRITMALTLDLKRKELNKEPLLTWDGKKFQKNWKIEYSNYLTDYGFKRPSLYAKPAQSTALRLTNVVKRIRDGKELSKVNLKTLEECYRFYPGAEEIIDKEKNNG